VAAAVELLARRDYSSGELTAKLRERGFAASAVHAVVSDLIEQRFIDDARSAAHRVSYQIGRGHGPLRIRRELAELEFDELLIETALAEHSWAQLARDVRVRKFGPERPYDWRERARQARFLQYRGFSADHIRSALGASDLDLDS
jgi:regulatory protein